MVLSPLCPFCDNKIYCLLNFAPASINCPLYIRNMRWFSTLKHFGV
uniref:Uncharacterized protein n=1 Tax=Rhizophora mucronata TaxID=61149 RepID=A0A2P2IXG5_RHIMU